MESVCKRASASGDVKEMLQAYFRVFGIAPFDDNLEVAKQVFGDDSPEIQKAEIQKRKCFGWDLSRESVQGVLVYLRHLAEVTERDALQSLAILECRESHLALLGYVKTLCVKRNWRMPTIPDVTRIATSQQAIEFVRAVEMWIDQQQLALSGDAPTLSQAQNPTTNSVIPTATMTDVVAAVAGAYEWATSKIDGADGMTIAQLFDAIQSHSEMTGEYLDRLPDNAETFGKYLKRAGIDRYNSSGARARRPSRRPRT